MIYLQLSRGAPDWALDHGLQMLAHKTQRLGIHMCSK